MLALPSAWADVSGPAAAYLARHGEPATIVAHLGALGDDIRRGLREGLVRRAAFPERAIADALAADDVRARIEAAWLAGAAGAATLAPAVVAAVDRAAAGWRAARTVELARGAAGRLAVTRAAEAWQAALWAAQRVGADVRAQAIAAAGDAAAPADVRAAAAAGSRPTRRRRCAGWSSTRIARCGPARGPPPAATRTRRAPRRRTSTCRRPGR
jgi:ParB family chromosome partitioning protein